MSATAVSVAASLVSDFVPATTSTSGAEVVEDEEVDDDDPFVIAGHLHPVLSIGTGARRVLAHAFVVDPRQAILPAFTPFARGARVQPDPDRGRRVLPIADGQVVEF